MVVIAHRGNIQGPKPEKENHPEYVEEALEMGFDVEIDVWRSAGAWYLGHDKPQYEVKDNFLYLPGLWLHAKNIDALYQLGVGCRNNHFFWHQTDDFTLTSHGIIWTYPGKEITNRSVIVVTDKFIRGFNPNDVYGICTDYPMETKAVSAILDDLR
jgi:hypothetical protein